MTFSKYTHFIFGAFIILTTFTVPIFAGVKFSRAIRSSRALHVWSTMTIIRYTGVWISITIRIRVTIYKQSTLTSKCTLCTIYITLNFNHVEDHCNEFLVLAKNFFYLEPCKMQIRRSFDRNRQSYKQNKYFSFLICSCS